MAKRKNPNGDGGMKKNPYKTYQGGYKGTDVSQIRPGWRPGDEYYGDLDDFNTRDSNEPLSPRPKRPNQYNANVEQGIMEPMAPNVERRWKPTSANIKQAIGGQSKAEQRLSDSIAKRRGSRRVAAPGRRTK